jgi:hypothetical protein
MNIAPNVLSHFFYVTLCIISEKMLRIATRIYCLYNFFDTTKKRKNKVKVEVKVEARIAISAEQCVIYSLIPSINSFFIGNPTFVTIG